MYSRDNILDLQSCAAGGAVASDSLWKIALGSSSVIVVITLYYTVRCFHSKSTL